MNAGGNGDVPDRREPADDTVTIGTRQPVRIDVSHPNVARVYDYLLGGKDNYAADRRLAERMLAVAPWARRQAWANRRFMQRAVCLLAGEVDQFLDLGTGLPTAGNVHEVALRANPNARVVYVDNDPVVLAHGRALLADESHQPFPVVVHEGDITAPQRIIDDVRDWIDFARPVAVLCVAILHFMDDPAAIVGCLREAMAPGSFLVISHTTSGRRPNQARAAARLYSQDLQPIKLRSEGEIRRLFEGFELVEPGLVAAHRWRPDQECGNAPGAVLAGVGHWSRCRS